MATQTQEPIAKVRPDGNAVGANRRNPYAPRENFFLHFEHLVFSGGFGNVSMRKEKWTAAMDWEEPAEMDCNTENEDSKNERNKLHSMKYDNETYPKYH